MSMTGLAWLAAALGAALACMLVVMEYLGARLPAWCPIKPRMWGRFVLLHLAGVLWLIFTDM